PTGRRQAMIKWHKRFSFRKSSTTVRLAAHRPKLRDGGHEARRLQLRRPTAVRCSALGGNVLALLLLLLRVLGLDGLGRSRAIILERDAEMTEHQKINCAQQKTGWRLECASINGSQRCPNRNCDRKQASSDHAVEIHAIVA